MATSSYDITYYYTQLRLFKQVRKSKNSGKTTNFISQNQCSLKDSQVTTPT